MNKYFFITLHIISKNGGFMNRLLVLVVIVLVPLAIIGKNEDTTVLAAETLESTYLEIPIEEKDNDSNKENTSNKSFSSVNKVLISNNRDKSNPFTIDLEEYIVGVVAGEMPASFNMEALKAQAVASRTFAVNKIETIKNYVLSTTINDQVYISLEEMKKKWGTDFNYYYDRVLKAVNETKGEVVTYNNKPISAYYFAISNGSTDDAKTVFKENKEYLVSVDSKWDKNFSSYVANRTISKTNFCNKLNISCNTITINKVVRSENNYVREITINNVKFTGIEVFNKLGLKSTDFTITVNGDNVNIKTLGFGHSVGMSQYGAQGMASSGYNYKDILSHYYKNTKIETI